MHSQPKRRLVVSGVNLTEGGTLTVFRECLRAASVGLPEWEIIALVHDRDLFETSRVHFIEFSDSKRSWLRRLYYEFWYFKRLSLELDADVWLSLHDISPRVTAKRRAVYCHNPSPFYAAGWRELIQEPRFFLFTKFYRYLYRLNIRSNDLVIVQQAWIREAFRRMYPVSQVAVAHPEGQCLLKKSGVPEQSGVFFYPALPRSFKNFEVLCEAALILQRRLGAVFEVRLTLSGAENSYAADLYHRYAALPVVKFIGRQSSTDMARQYEEAAAIVFPSLLETWGLPISEAKAFNKILLLADLPYAHETLGTYQRAEFFSPRDANALADLMQAQIEGKLVCRPHRAVPVAEPFAENWQGLLGLVIQ